MDDLLSNFSLHIGNAISPALGEKLNYYIINSTKNDNDYEEVEHEIKNIISSHFKNCEKENFIKIANNLYNAYVEKDDANIVNSIRFMIRIYSKFQEFKLKKMLYRWRINILYYNPNKNNKSKQSIQNIKVLKENKKSYHTLSDMGNSEYKIENKARSRSKNREYRENQENQENRTQKNENENFPISIENYTKRKNYPAQQNNFQKQNGDIFNKLYMDAFIKQDEKILHDELKRLSELDECTFQPNKKK